MITYGQSGSYMYCFAKDAVVNDYQILHVEMVKQKKQDSDLCEYVPVVRDQLHGCVQIVGKIEVVLSKNIQLVDFTSYPHNCFNLMNSLRARKIEVFRNWQGFEILSVELPMGTFPRFIELAVIPGTVFGVSWQGLISATANYSRSQEYWLQNAQKSLPFEESVPAVDASVLAG